MTISPHEASQKPEKLLLEHFHVTTLESFGIENKQECIAAGGLLLDYLRQTQKSGLEHLKPIRRLSRSDKMVLDESTIRNLELFETMRDAKREGSLIAVLDHTASSMGARLLRSFLLAPLLKKEAIIERFDAVSELVKNFDAGRSLIELLKKTLDVERLLGRIGVGASTARDLGGIRQSLLIFDELSDVLKKMSSGLFKKLSDELVALRSLIELRTLLQNAIVEDPGVGIHDGGMINDGYCEQLDQLKAISREGKKMILEIQNKAIEETGIQSLKVKYNQVFGYFIEVTKSNLHKVPGHYFRKQTMTNAERFITPELKEYEEKILGAEEKIKALEYKLFCEIRDRVVGFVPALQTFSGILGTTDVILSFAHVARQYRYVRPEITDFALHIKNGRHPVVEHMFATTDFIANDICLDEETRALLITGPNMGGKSTYLRQVALMTLMAHIGCFVPAEYAHIPQVDRIFTRVGASDNLVKGQSTFMVEMVEAAHILTQATEKSLIILDEVGRGTSTYDGVSLAWAILEYIHDTIKAKTLFATHYHELISVVKQLPRAKNYSVAVQENNDGIIFLYKVVEGPVDKSYGIEVAKLAGLPREVTARAESILHELEEGIVDRGIEAKLNVRLPEDQMGLFEPRQHRTQREPLFQELDKIDVNTLTPLEALKKLDELKRME